MIACRYFRAVRRGLGRVPSWPRPRSNLAGLVSGGLEALALPTGRMKRDASRVPKVRFGSQTAGRRRHAPRPISGLIRHTASAEGMPGNSHDRRFRRGYADMLGPVRALLPPTSIPYARRGDVRRMVARKSYGLWPAIRLSGDFLRRPDAGLVRPVAGALPAIDGGLTGKEQAFID